MSTRRTWNKLRCAEALSGIAQATHKLNGLLDELFERAEPELSTRLEAAPKLNPDTYSLWKTARELADRLEREHYDAEPLDPCELPACVTSKPGWDGRAVINPRMDAVEVGEL